MTAEVKLRTLAAANASLQAVFGTPLFRFFDRQLPPGYITSGSCVRMLRVSTIRGYSQQGIQTIDQILFQFDVLDLDSEAARAAAAALIAWFSTINIASNQQFGSPVTTPQQFPNFVLNQRAGMEPRTQPPVYVESVDVRVFNLEAS